MPLVRQMNPVTTRTLTVLAAFAIVVGAMIASPLGRLAVVGFGGLIALIPVAFGTPRLRLTGAVCLAVAVILVFDTQVPALQEAATYRTAAEAPSDGFESVTIAGYFTCEVPVNWRRSGESVASGTGDLGIRLEGPGSGPIPVRVEIRYYAGGGEYPSFEHYIQSFSRPTLGTGLEGEQYEAVQKVMLSGRTGYFFGRTKKIFLPPEPSLVTPAEEDVRIYEGEERIASPFLVRERYVVLPATSGFYALQYSAPSERYDASLSVFDRIVNSFRVRGRQGSTPTPRHGRNPRAPCPIAVRSD